jgi:hypothetical protein
MEAGTTWSEVRLAVDRTRWRRFTDALCSRGSNRKWWWVRFLNVASHSFRFTDTLMMWHMFLR